MPKHDFFVHYEYGLGALWAVIRARSIRQIQGRYRDLVVHRDVPAALSAEMLADIRRTNSLDIDDPPNGWLADLLRADDAPPVNR